MRIDGFQPIPGTVLGQYRASGRFAILNSQAQDGRLIELRSTTQGIVVVPTSFKLGFQQTGAFTSAMEQGFDVRAASAFTVVATTNTQSPTIVPLKTGYPTATAALRALAAAGNAAGMTGGTITSGAILEQLVAWVTAALPTTAFVPSVVIEAGPRISDGEPPFQFAKDEGLQVTYRPNGPLAQSGLGFFDITWSEIQVS